MPEDFEGLMEQIMKKVKKVKSKRKCIYCHLPPKNDKIDLCEFHWKSSKGGFYKLKK